MKRWLLLLLWMLGCGDNVEATGPAWDDGAGDGARVCAEGSFRCSGAALALCLRGGYVVVLECAAADACDAAGGRCGAAPADGGPGDCASLPCEDDFTALRCGEAGAVERVECPADRPYCDGLSQCVACRDSGDCPEALEECREPQCAQGRCTTVPAARGQVVGAGPPHDCKGPEQCDGAGGTFFPAAPDDLPSEDGNPCTLELCDMDAPASAPVAAGGACPGGRCDGAGRCIAYFCGDGLCTQGETSVSCPRDCGSVCGDGACNGSETPLGCPQDCSGGGGA